MMPQRAQPPAKPPWLQLPACTRAALSLALTSQLHEAEQAHGKELGVQELALHNEVGRGRPAIGTMAISSSSSSSQLAKLTWHNAQHKACPSPQACPHPAVPTQHTWHNAQLKACPSPHKPAHTQPSQLTSPAAAATRASACCCSLPAASGVIALWLRAHSSIAAASAGKRRFLSF